MVLRQGNKMIESVSYMNTIFKQFFCVEILNEQITVNDTFLQPMEIFGPPPKG
jgi:hypothetical protein